MQWPGCHHRCRRRDAHREERALMTRSTPPRTPWWEALPEDFWQRAETTDVGDCDPLTVLWSTSLDLMLRVPLASLVTLALVQGGAGSARDMEALDFYESIARTGDVAQAFVRPRRDIHIQRRPL